MDYKSKYYVYTSHSSEGISEVCSFTNAGFALDHFVEDTSFTSESIMDYITNNGFYIANIGSYGDPEFGLSVGIIIDINYKGPFLSDFEEDEYKRGKDDLTQYLREEKLDEILDEENE